MPVDFTKWLSSPSDAVREKILQTVRNRYFPEVWYILENWFSTSHDKSVLDVGCGNGLIAEALAKTGHQVTCIDPVVDCLLATQERFSKSELEGRFEQADPESLPFATHSFQNLICINMLELTESRKRTMREINRVLKPGGRAVIATFARRSPWGITSIAKQVRNDSKSETSHFMSKAEFVKAVQKEKLKLERLKGGARYMPSSGASKMRIPLNGVYIALISKPMMSEDDEQYTSAKDRPGKDFMFSND
jgi:2-polyprenyl-6-hydroxyphenyl methylase/3-demethylubiquinone-9 3-methyltransferase